MKTQSKDEQSGIPIKHQGRTGIPEGRYQEHKEPTPQAIERVQGEITGAQDTLATVEAQIVNVESLTCTVEEAKKLPNLKQKSLVLKIQLNDLEKLLTSLKDTLTTEATTDLIAEVNGLTETIGTIIPEVLVMLDSPLKAAIKLDGVWAERRRLYKKAVELAPGDSRLLKLHDRTGGVVSDIAAIGQIVVGIVKHYILVFGSGYARDAITCLGSPPELVKIIDDAEKQYLNQLHDLKRRAKEEKPLLEARKQRALDRIKLNTKIQKEAKKKAQEEYLRPDWQASDEVLKARAEKLEEAKASKAKAKLEAIEYQAELQGYPVPAIPE